jgi:hypothetical protein
MTANDSLVASEIPLHLLNGFWIVGRLNFFTLIPALNASAPELLKDITLVGELYGGRREFQSTVSILKAVNSPHWQNITFQVRDWRF